MDETSASSPEVLQELRNLVAAVQQIAADRDSALQQIPLDRDERFGRVTEREITDAERIRNRTTGDYLLLTRLLGRIGTAAIAPTPPAIEPPGRWSEGKVFFEKAPPDTRVIRLRERSFSLEQTVTLAGDSLTLTNPLLGVLNDRAISSVGFYDDRDSLIAHGRVSATRPIAHDRVSAIPPAEG